MNNGIMMAIEGAQAMRVFTFCVYAGGSKGTQVGPFLIAFSRVQLMMKSSLRLRMDLITCKDVGESSMTEEELISRLWNADVHVILGHIHQGNPQWSALTIQEHLNVLADHVGWPSFENLKCPVFTQDKYNYIKMCPDISIPTLQINFGGDQTEAIVAFISLHDEGKGWMVKLSFTTNSERLSFCNSGAEILRAVEISESMCGHRMSYALLQPCLANRREYKVVVLEGTAKYIADIAQRRSLGTPFSNQSELMKFAEQACEILEARCRGALIHPILRVDIMESTNGLVVNEFESIEACYSSLKFDTHQLAVQSFLEEFWVQTIQLLAIEAMNDDN
jgi:hypothetical protein